MSSQQSMPLDRTLVAALRREGAAIVAQERGLTPACRVRLAQAARTLGIAEERIEEVIRAISEVEPTAPPNPQVERFRQRLKKDLAVKPAAVIGPTTEAKIFSSANRKFGLSEAVAREVLADVAAEMGMARITASEAIGSLAEQIDRTVGESTWLAREGWDRLRSAGDKWGLELELIDALIEERLAANRTAHRSRGFWTRAVLIGTGGAVLAAAAVLVALGFGVQGSGFRAQRTRDSGQGTGGKGQETDDATPRWWDADLAIDFSAAIRNHKDLESVFRDIRAARARDRAAGYAKLVEGAFKQHGDQDGRSAVQLIAVGCLALEPDEESAKRLQTALLERLPGADGNVAWSTQQLGAAMWAAETLTMVSQRRGIAAERKNETLGAMTMALGGSPPLALSNQEQLQWARERVVLGIYEQLAIAAAKQPEIVAAAYPGVAARAAVELSESELLEVETTLLAAALPAAGAQWRVYERAIGHCVSSPDVQKSLGLAQALARVTDASLVEHLSKLLIARSGAEPKSAAKKDVVRAVRKALGNDNARVMVVERWQALEDEAASALAAARDGGHREILAQTLVLAHLTTLAIALAQGDAGVAVFDAQIDETPVLQDAQNEDAGTSPARATVSRAELSQAEQRELAKCLDVFRKREQAAQRDREAAWRRLAALAKDVDDVPPGAAAQVAAVALAKIDEAERSVALAALKQAGRWTHLRLAIADELEASRAAVDERRRVVETLIAQPVDAAATPAELRRVLLRHVLAELTEGKDSRLVGGTLIDAATARLAGSYRQRLLLLGADAAAGDAGLAATCEALIGQLALEASGRRSGAEQVRREIDASLFLTGEGTRYVVALQRILIELSAQRLAARRPERVGAAQQIVVQWEAEAARAADALEQLRDQERTLLQLWMLYAQDG